MKISRKQYLQNFILSIVTALIVQFVLNVGAAPTLILIEVMVIGHIIKDVFVKTREEENSEEIK